MKITKDELKKRFRTGMYPTQADFENLVDTLAGVDDMIDITKIENLEKALQDKANRDSLEFHAANKTNPHDVTAAQVGLGNADNTADVDKPISNATQEALNLKANETALQEGLSDVLETINQETLQKVSERGNATNVNLVIPDAVNDSHAATLRQVRQGLQEALQALADRVGNAEDNVTMEFLNAEIAKLNLLVTSDDLNLDTIQEIVVFIKANSDVIDAISTNKLDKITFDNWKTNVYTPFIGGVYSKVEMDGLLEGKAGNNHAHADVTQEVSGFMSAEDKVKLNGIATGATNYSHPVNHSPSVILQDLNSRFVSDAEKSTWNGNLISKTAYSIGADTAVPAPTISGTTYYWQYRNTAAVAITIVLPTIAGKRAPAASVVLSAGKCIEISAMYTTVWVFTFSQELTQF